MRLNLFRKSAGRTAQGLIGRLISRAAPSWAAAPLHRVSQTLFLGLFVVLLLYVVWPYSSPQVAETRQAREIVDAETVLRLDPLLSVSTSLASRTLVRSLLWAAAILAISLVIPRGFCAYVCPLGTLIDLWDWAVGRRLKKLRLRRRGWWVNLKYYLLAATLVSALCGVMLAGFVAAIPVLTRGFLMIAGPLQVGLVRQWHMVPPVQPWQIVSIALFVLIFALGFLRPRFWCRYVCPTGAMFSVATLLRLSDRKVQSSCIGCARCVKVCPFEAIKSDYSTRTADCTFCQRCGGECPVGAIKFVGRWDRENLKTEGEPPAGEVSLSRRGFLIGTVGGVAGFALTRYALGAGLAGAGAYRPVRPPGSVPEEKFLQLCIRCGECMKACPNHCLQPLGFRQGLDGLWTPHLVADWAGCYQNCNNCGQVCPTGAIRALSLEERRAARMGCAVVTEKTCLPHAGREACRLCVDQCDLAGYHAMEFFLKHVEMDEQGMPIPGTGWLAPVVLADKCVGCGQCQSRCYNINVTERGLLAESAIVVLAGQGREDRLVSGSYIELRKAEQRKRESQKKRPAGGDTYLPDFME